MKRFFRILICLLIVTVSVYAWFTSLRSDVPFSLDSIAAYNDQPAIEIHDNVPYFDEDPLLIDEGFFFENLDLLGRSRKAEGMIGPETLCYEEREPLDSVTPSGWKNERYDFIERGYLYNRCHLIGFRLCGENANEKNLMTGTRYLNIQGMQVYEMKILSYVNRTGNHVKYRVTPIYQGSEAVARGVLMEAESVEDDGLSFCVYCYNVQPGVDINYENGASKESTAIRSGYGTLLIYRIVRRRSA